MKRTSSHMGEQFDSREFLESAADYFWQPVRNYTSIRKQKLSKHTPPKTNQKKMPTFTRRNEQVEVPEGSFQKGVNSFQWDYSPTQAGFPFPEGDSSGQFQRGSAERLTKPDLKTTGNRMTRKSSMMVMGSNFQ